MAHMVEKYGSVIEPRPRRRAVHRVLVPCGLERTLQLLSAAVIREQPENIVLFCAQYFQRRLLRRQSNQDFEVEEHSAVRRNTLGGDSRFTEDDRNISSESDLGNRSRSNSEQRVEETFDNLHQQKGFPSKQATEDRRVDDDSELPGLSVESRNIDEEKLHEVCSHGDPRESCEKDPVQTHQNFDIEAVNEENVEQVDPDSTVEAVGGNEIEQADLNVAVGTVDEEYLEEAHFNSATRTNDEEQIDDFNAIIDIVDDEKLPADKNSDNLSVDGECLKQGFSDLDNIITDGEKIEELIECVNDSDQTGGLGAIINNVDLAEDGKEFPGNGEFVNEEKVGDPEISNCNSTINKTENNRSEITKVYNELVDEVKEDYSKKVVDPELSTETKESSHVSNIETLNEAEDSSVKSYTDEAVTELQEKFSNRVVSNELPTESNKELSDKVDIQEIIIIERKRSCGEKEEYKSETIDKEQYEALNEIPPNYSECISNNSDDSTAGENCIISDQKESFQDATAQDPDASEEIENTTKWSNEHVDDLKLENKTMDFDSESMRGFQQSKYGELIENKNLRIQRAQSADSHKVKLSKYSNKVKYYSPDAGNPKDNYSVAQTRRSFDENTKKQSAYTEYNRKFSKELPTTLLQQIGFDESDVKSEMILSGRSTPSKKSTKSEYARTPGSDGSCGMRAMIKQTSTNEIHGSNQEYEDTNISRCMSTPLSEPINQYYTKKYSKESRGRLVKSFPSSFLEDLKTDFSGDVVAPENTAEENRNRTLPPIKSGNITEKVVSSKPFDVKNYENIIEFPSVTETDKHSSLRSDDTEKGSFKTSSQNSLSNTSRGSTKLPQIISTHKSLECSPLDLSDPNTESKLSNKLHGDSVRDNVEPRLGEQTELVENRRANSGEIGALGNNELNGNILGNTGREEDNCGKQASLSEEKSKIISNDKYNEEETIAAVQLQSSFRGHRTRMILMEQQYAVVKIQALFRGYISRKRMRSNNDQGHNNHQLRDSSRYANLKKSQETGVYKNKEDRVEEFAAVVIQSIYRGWKTRQKLTKSEMSTKHNSPHSLLNLDSDIPDSLNGSKLVNEEDTSHSIVSIASEVAGEYSCDSLLLLKNNQLSKEQTIAIKKIQKALRSWLAKRDQRIKENQSSCLNDFHRNDKKRNTSMKDDENAQNQLSDNCEHVSFGSNISSSQNHIFHKVSRSSSQDQISHGVSRSSSSDQVSRDLSLLKRELMVSLQDLRCEVDQALKTVEQTARLASDCQLFQSNILK